MLIVDYHRKLGRRKLQSLEKDDEQHVVPVNPGAISDPLGSAIEREEIERLHAACQRVLDPQHSSYRVPEGRYVQLYDTMLVQRWRRNPEASMRSIGRTLKRYFMRYHNTTTEIGTYDETFACRRMADILNKLRTELGNA